MAHGGHQGGSGIGGMLAEFLSEGYSGLKDFRGPLSGEPMTATDVFDAGVSIIQSLAGEAWATPIIAAGLDTLLVYSALCGDPVSPDSGTMFGDGAAGFEGISDALDSAEPTSQWTGLASTHYAIADANQTNRAADLARADRTLQTVIAREAQQVETTRDVIDERASKLTESIPVALAALLLEPEGLVLFELLQIAAVLGTVPFAAAKVSELAWNASENAETIDRVAAEYDRVAGYPVLTAMTVDTMTISPTTPGPRSRPGPPSGPSLSPAATGVPNGSFPAAGAGELSAPSGSSASPAAVRPPGYVLPGTPVAGDVPAAAGPGSPSESALMSEAVDAVPAGSAPAGSGSPIGSLPGLPGGAPGAGVSGVVSSLLGPAVQALGQIGQGTSGAVGGTPVAAGPVSPKASVEPDGEAARLAEADRKVAPVEEAGAGGHGTRAPIHVEIELDPQQLNGPVHMTLDPKTQ